MSATRDFSRWAREIVNDPSYPAGLPKDEHTVALYVEVAEALAEATEEEDCGPDFLPFGWIPRVALRREVTN